MGRLRTLAILLTLVVWGSATEGSPPDGDASSATRPPLQAPVAKYLQGGIDLYQRGDSRAAQYLKVANDYRDQLQPGEQAQLDTYLAKLNPGLVDPAVRPASSTQASDVATQAATPVGSGSSPSPSSGVAPSSSPRNPADVKQDARWKLSAAKEQMRLGNYDDASAIVAQVQQMNVKWGLFDETPTKVAEMIAKTRPKSPTSASSGVHDKRTALARLKEARKLMANSQFEQAEAIAMDVDSWKLSYGLMEDKPSNVAAAARALRKRDMTRALPPKAQPSSTLYDGTVAEARHLVAVGKLDEAEGKARLAQRMNVIPDATSDRAENVLSDIATARARLAANIASPSPNGSETASVLLEREANDLLARGKNAEAGKKLAEADRLKALESSQPTGIYPPGIDANVRRVSDPSPMPAGVALEAPGQVPAFVDNTAPPVLEAPPAIVTQVPSPSPTPVDPNAPPMPMPMPAPSVGSQPPMPSLSGDPLPSGNKGEELLGQAKALFSSGNYPAARDKANEAKTGQYGVDARADEMLAQIALSEQGGALAVYEAALEAIRGKAGTPPDYDRARALLNEVAASGASLDEGMMQKVQDLLLKLPKDNKGTATASDVPTSDAESLKAQQYNKEVGDKVAEARRMMETDPEKGIALLQTTLVSVKAAELPQAVSRTMIRRLEVAIDLANKDKVAFDAKMKDKGARTEIETKKLRILEADNAKRAAIKELMDKAEKAQAEGDWAKAEEYARRADAIDPNELAAGILAYKANMQRHYETYTKDKKDKEEGFLNELHSIDQTMIINGNASRNGIDFPKDFKDMADRRRRMQLSDQRPRSNDEMAIAKKLDEPITLNLKDQSLGEAITFIQNYTGLNVILDPKALNDEGLSTDSKVTLQANSIKLRTALKFMLKPLGLTYKAEDGVLLITSPQASREKTYSWTYPVADLVVPPAKMQPNPTQPSSTPMMPNTDPASLQAMAMSSNSTSAASPTVTLGQKVISENDMQPLIALITNTIAPGTWRVTDITGKGDGVYGMGGGLGGAGNDAADIAQPGSITPFMLSISLIIRHTAEVHEEVAELLKQLRRLQDLQVSIEVRFITVSDDFFEQIGVDFDFNIQSGAVGKNSSFAAPSGSNQAASYPFNLVSSTSSGNTGGTSTTGGSTSTTGGGSTSTTTGGTNTGGTTGGGGAGGTGGFAGGGGTTTSGGGFAGGGGGVGGAGNFGGGTTGGGSTSTTGGGTSTSTSSGSQVGYVVNPFLDHSLGRTPVVVGTSAGGVGNYTSNLGIPFTQGSASQIAPFNAIQTAGATFGISFLSELEMYLFLTAAQGDARNNIVQAPKITTFNGANATISNNELQYFVASLIPIVGPGSVAFFPQPQSLPDGVTLSVTPVVSSDRRYVRLSLAPFFQTINGLQSFPVPAAVGGGGLGGNATSITGQIQLPLTTTTTLNTTVTVPDGGTVLLGGVKRMREQRLEYGVPVLSKTPYINRLFRNIGVGRRTDSLMLMVTPRIIILEEEEARLGVQTIGNNANP